MSTQIAVNGVTFGDGTTQNTASVSAFVAGGVILEANTIISSNYTITSGKNGLSAGPITINSGVTVTVPSGSVWTIV
jgi:hypothetical protein